MAEMGLGQIARLELDRYDDTTVAALTVYSPPEPDTRQRRALPVNTLSEDSKRVWTGVVDPYDEGGLWYHIWTVTGMGYGRIVHEVPVIPDRMADPGFTYASTSDLAAWLRDAPPADAERMLQAATREVDSLLLTSRYLTDADGYPADLAQRRAVRDAACALVEWWVETGDAYGAAGMFGSMSAGSISVGRATAAGGDTSSGQARVNAQVRRILAAEGLLGHAPAVYG
jgi:hypothetical protein